MNFIVGEFVWDKNRTVCELLEIRDTTNGSMEFVIRDSIGLIHTNNIQKIKHTPFTFRECVNIIANHNDIEPIFSKNHPTLESDEVHYIKNGIRVVFINDNNSEYYFFTKTILDDISFEIKSIRFGVDSVDIMEKFNIFETQLTKHLK